MKNLLTEMMVKNLILNWYNGTNDHLPVEDLERMLADDVKMSYPNVEEPFTGLPAFRKWYADVLQKYFDETHVVEWWNIKINGNSSEAVVIVRWETRGWPIGKSLSTYNAYLSQQRFKIERCLESGRVFIREKHVETFNQTAPAYGPYETHRSTIVRNAMIALVSANPLATEAFYTKHFGFRRARVYLPGNNQVVVLKSDNNYIQIFPAVIPRPSCLDTVTAESPYPGGAGAGPLFPGVRKLAFLINDVEKKLADMGEDAKITQSMRDGLIPGSRIVWIADPSGNVVELIEGYYDEANPPAPPVDPGVEIPIWKQELNIDKAVEHSRKGNVKKVTEWLRAGGNPDQYDKEGWTPLLAAAVRAKSDTVELLLENPYRKANPCMPHGPSGALPIHFAGHSGDVKTAELLLNVCPDHLDRVWDLNGHTLFLQAVFYGHLKLAKYSLEKGANTAITTVRGLGGIELAAQFQNNAMMDIIRPYDKPASEKKEYINAFLKKIAPIVPAEQAATQKLSDQLVKMIEDQIMAIHNDGNGKSGLDKIRYFIESNSIDVNRLGGPLQQPPLVVTVTGNNGEPTNPDVAKFRLELAKYLLDCGADPILQEHHPMAVNAIIRAAVFNHLDIMKAMGEKLSPQRLTDALNEQPSVNGLTALHDTVLRAGTAGPDRLEGYLDQIRWFIQNGARHDIEDFSGRTQRSIAENIDDIERRQKVLDALIDNL